MSFALPPDIYSPDQLSQAVLDLQDLASHVRSASARGTPKEELKDAPELMLQLLKANGVDKHDITAVEALADEAQKTLNSAPTARIMLAAAPGTIIKREVTDWFRKNTSPLVLLTFSARSDLGGGIVVQAGSRLYDMSFRRQILENKTRISEIAGV